MVKVLDNPSIRQRFLSLFKNKKTFFLVVILFIATIITIQQVFIRQDVRQRAAGTNPERVQYLGRDWYFFGANVPWYNWGCDFGCNSNGGVTGTKQTIGQGFQKLKDAGMNTARWWVFPDEAWQISRDASGMPTGINQAVYADFDAALALAEQYDLYYNFVLFSSATTIPRTWLTNPAQRTKLAQVLGTLFARYKDNPRVMSWEIFNEPEFQIWNNEIDEASVVATGTEIAASVHANSNALVTVGQAMVDGIPMWKNANLDYYSPHWYDYMSSGNWCALCTNAQELRNRYGIDKPIVLGELYVGSDTNPLNRYSSIYSKGFAGAWPWSLFSNKTGDGLTIDFSAAQQFSVGKTDLGPRGNINTPTPTNAPTNAPTATPTPTTNQPTPTNNPSPTPITPQSVLSLLPASQQTITGNNITTTISISTGTQTINGFEATLTFPQSLLDVVSVNTNSSSFDVVAQNTNSTGRIDLALGSTTPLAGNLTAAQITFKTKSSGVAPVSFSSPAIVSNISNQNVLLSQTGGNYTIVTPTPTPTPSPTPTPIPAKVGDMNGDNNVDVQDLSYLLSRWKTNDSKADINRDGTVNTLDLSALLSNWKK